MFNKACDSALVKLFKFAEAKIGVNSLSAEVVVALIAAL